MSSNNNENGSSKQPSRPSQAPQPSRRKSFADTQILSNAWANMGLVFRPFSKNSVDGSLRMAPSVALSQDNATSINVTASLPAEGASEAGSATQRSISPEQFAKELVMILPQSLSQVRQAVVNLARGNSEQTRQVAAHDVASGLARLHISDRIVFGIWELSKDLLHGNSTSSGAALSLLLNCILATTLDSPTRHAVWKDLTGFSEKKWLALRIQVTYHLANKGRNVESLDGILGYTGKLIVEAFEACMANRKLKREEVKPDTLAERDLRDSMELLKALIKASAPFLPLTEFGQISALLAVICKSTENDRDVRTATQIMVMLPSYTGISDEDFQPCVDALCYMYGKNGRLENKYLWSVLLSVFQSHLRPKVVDILFRRVQNPVVAAQPGEADDVVLEITGALRILCDLVKTQATDDAPNIPFVSVMAAVYHAARTAEMPEMGSTVMTFWAAVVQDELLWRNLFEYSDWKWFRESVIGAAGLVLKGSDSLQSDGLVTLDSITSKICKEFGNLHVLQQEECVKLFFNLGALCSDFAVGTLLTYLTSNPHLVSPANSGNREIWTQLFKTFAHSEQRPQSVRCHTLMLLSDLFDGIQHLPLDDVRLYVELFMESMRLSEDIDVLETTAMFASKVLKSAFGEVLFDTVMKPISTVVLTDAASSNERHPFKPPPATDPSAPSARRVVVRHVIRAFLKVLNDSAPIAFKLYSFALDVAKNNVCDADARICALKLLFRIRCTGDFRVYVAPFSESETIAAVLCRTEETARARVETDNVVDKEARMSATGNTLRSRSLKRPVPPLWFYPGPKALPEDPFKTPSTVIYASVPTIELAASYKIIEIKSWLEIVIGLLQDPKLDWEIYSYVLVHFGAQLKNASLFTDAILFIKHLRSQLCDQIRNSTFHEPPNHTSLRKDDVAVCVFHMLTMLICYTPSFTKNEDDEMVNRFMQGIGSWDGTSKWCIHALSICCHELPLSVSKSLEGILQKMSQIITQPQIAIHILEFLCGLARLPEVHKNFHDHEYKLVFGISIRYLQFVREQRYKPEESRMLQPHPTSKSKKRQSDVTREPKEPEPETRSKPRQDELPAYVYALAFHAITFWFMALKLQDRPQYIPWISKSLTYTDASGTQIVEDQGLVTMDMMDRVAYTDRDETRYEPNFAREVDGEVESRTWAVGLGLLTIQTAGKSGLSQLTRRRPSGTRYTIYKPSFVSIPSHQAPLTDSLDVDEFLGASQSKVLPTDVLQEMYSSVGLDMSWQDPPLLFPDEEFVNRALRLFDGNHVVDSHKLGVIYIAPDQKNEAEILSNLSGSPAYEEFVSQLGTLIRLKGSTINTHGLDRHEDMDGKFARAWRDRATEIVFLTTTMMPNMHYDANRVSKKKHIGNSFVNVIWNDGGSEFGFDTFPGAFNYVHIVITPESKSDFVAQRLDASAAGSRAEHGDAAAAANGYSGNNLPGPNAIPPLLAEPPPYQTTANSRLTYKLQVLTAKGFPSISPAAEMKMVTAKSLAPLVRLLALNASFFSLVWTNKLRAGENADEFDFVVSSWRNRLSEIRKLRQRYEGGGGATGTGGTGIGSGGGMNGNSGTGRGQSPARHNHATGHNASTSSGARQRISLGFGGLGGGD